MNVNIQILILMGAQWMLPNSSCRKNHFLLRVGTVVPCGLEHMDWSGKTTGDIYVYMHMCVLISLMSKNGLLLSYEDTSILEVALLSRKRLGVRRLTFHSQL